MPATRPTLHVRVISPQKLILDTDASSISSKNLEGSFDILPSHINFITLVEGKPIVIRIPGQSKAITLNFPIAIIISLENKVDIYTYTPTASS